MLQRTENRDPRPENRDPRPVAILAQAILDQVSAQRMMFCQQCSRFLPHDSWTESQWKQKLSDVGGRNECRSCWKAGPRASDYQEVEDRARELHELSHQNLTLQFQDFMVALLQSLPRVTRKDWSYKGVLPVRCPTDFRTSTWRNTFDPGNRTYFNVIMAEVPDIQRLMGWAFRPSKALCGDCIESLLAIDDAPGFSSRTFAGISVHDGANFFREMSYKTWRVWRVIQWHNETVRTGGAPWVFTDVLKSPVHSTGCTQTTRCIRCTLDVPHAATMRCTRCGTLGCGLAISLCTGGLLCRKCKNPDPVR